MSKRFFVESPIILGEITLDGPEAHHLISVMRAKVGDEVILFDGSGVEFKAAVIDSNRKQVRLEVTQACEIDRELPIDIEIATALPKGDRQRVLIEKLVEIGVAKFVPLVTDRGVAKPETKSIARLKRMVVEASKQCQRNILMEIASATKSRDYFAQVHGNSNRLIAMPRVESVSLKTIVVDKPCRCVIGPEGGFTDDEFDAAIAAGWQACDLGKRILRAETAAILIASYLGSVQ